jgi:hypothetical protein
VAVHLVSPLSLFVEFSLAFGDDLIFEPTMTLLRGDIIDAGVQVLGVVPLKVLIKVPHGISPVKESSWVARGCLCGTKC